MTNRHPMSESAPPTLPRRIFLGCAATATACMASGCSTGHAAETTPFTVSAAQIPIGGAKFFPDQSTVVTQPNPGEFQAFSTVCTHQGCTVNEIRDGFIRCPCHGSRFHLADGSAQRGPARQPLTRRATTVNGTDIRIT
jgi:nitrite reductase/ring-hydroxylating ferredoxin subunit